MLMMTPPCLAHMRQHLARGADQAEDIDIELLDHLLVRAVLERGEKTEAGIVDQHVDFARLGYDLRDGAADRSGVRTSICTVVT
jgi:hypothetical protein